MQTEQYETHPVWNILDTYRDLVEADLHAWDDTSRYWVHRVHAGCELVESLRDLDPVLVEENALPELQNSVQQIVNMLETYLKDTTSNRTYLEQAAQYVGGIRTTAQSHFPKLSPTAATASTKAAASRYRKSLDKEADRLAARIKALEDDLTQTRALAQQAQQSSNQRLEELSNEIATRENEIAAITVNLNEQITEQKKSFQEESATRTKRTQTTLQEIRDTEDIRVANATKVEEKRIAAALESAKNARTDLEGQGSEMIAALSNYRDQAKALVDTTSRHAVAGDYGTWASRQSFAAFWWTIFAVVVGLGTAVILIFAISTAADDSVQFTLYKTSISVIGLIVAGYSARQASEHRREERASKRLSLDLAALGPFLEQVEDAEPLRQAVAKRVFAPEVVAATHDRDSQMRLRVKSLSFAEIIELIKIAK